MRRPVTLVAALLLATAFAPLSPGIATGDVPEPAAGGALEPVTISAADLDGPPGAVATPANSSTLLDLGPPSATAYTRPTVGLSSAVGVQYDALDARLENYSIRESYAAASSTRARLALLDDALVRVETRASTLDRRWRNSYAGFANGSVGTAAFVATAGEISASAESRRETVDVVRELVSEIDPDATTEPATTEPATTSDPVAGIDAEQVQNRARAIVERARAVDARLEELSGPTETLIGESLQGLGETEQLYLAATDAGAVISTVHDGTYYRVLSRSDVRDGGEPTLDPAAASDVVESTYPWAWNASTERRIDVLPSGSHRATITYPGGTVTAYLDGASGEVYRERHAMNLSAYPAGSVVEWSQSGLVLRVNETYAGGPLRVTLRGDEGEPLDGQLTVDDTTVGRTGEDGVLWTVSPDGRGDVGDVIVTAELDDGSQVSLTYRTVGQG